MKISFPVLFLLTCSITCWSQQVTPAFDVVPLGVKGGSDESNLSSYAVAVKGTTDYVCLDAGTVNYGIQVAIKNGVFKGFPEDIIKTNIKGYLISHAHLDHVAGLVINSPDDSPKNIYGLSSCLDILKEKYFTWKNWANFTNEGEKPQLNKYHYVTLEPGTETPLENTTMTVKAYPLSHVNPYESTAFLIGHNDSYLLYLGDTGADEIEKSDRLKELWKEVSPLVQANKLRAIFIEVSFSNDQKEDKLFGHLTPNLLMKEMKLLNNLSDLKNVSIVVTHRKPSGDREAKIKKQLEDLNALKLKLVFPAQGKKISF
ncbi:MAG TPA: 3',5'-cyclic-nucleotide phosphodiesterase [Cyclobacteriaceae bacterium]